MREKALIVGVVVAAGLTAMADYAIYGGDVAAESVTNQETRILFSGNADGRTYTLSADASIHSGGMAETGSAGAPKKAIFDFTSGNHTLALRSGNFLVYNRDVELWFKGGTWDFGGRPFYAVGKSGGANGYGDRNLIVLTNGCKFTNGSIGNNASCVLYGSSDIRMIITDGSSSQSTLAMGMFCNMEVNGVSSTNMYFEVSDGSLLKCNDFTFDERYSSALASVDRGNRMLVTGEGSAFTNTGSFIMGKGTRGNVLEVADGASVKIGYPRLGYSADTSETGIYVHDGASFVVANSMLFGSSNGSSYTADKGGMFLRVVDATASIGATGGQNLILGSANNELFLSNATFKCVSFRVGEVAGGTNNKARILGPDSSFSSSSWKPLFGNGGCGLVEIGDRANVAIGEIDFDSWDDNADHAATYASSSNTLRVTGGATLSLSKSGAFTVGKSKEMAASDNKVEVSDGATLDTYTTTIFEGYGSTLVVDNATFSNACDTISSQGNDGVAVYFGRAANGRTSTNCTLIVRGTHPRIRIPKTTLLFGGNSILRFELPPNGYDYETEGEAPLELHQLMNQSMDYEIAGLDELQKNITGRRKDIPLVKMTYRMWDGSAAFAAINRINAKLEVSNPGCYLHKESNPAGGQIIYLRVKKPAPGTSIRMQ